MKRPEFNVLKNDIINMKNIINLANYYSVTQETIRKWLKLYNLVELQKNLSSEFKKTYKIEKLCCICNKKLTNKNKSGYCIDCKSKCPDKIQLENDLFLLKTKVAIGKKYNVTDNCIKKWMKKYNL